MDSSDGDRRDVAAKRGVDWPRVALVSAVACAVAIDAVNRARGDLLGNFYAGYAGGGSCKLRGDDAFRLLIAVGLLAFPLAVGAGVSFAVRLWRARDRRSAVGLAIAALTLFALHRLDFADAALGICGEARSPSDQVRDRARAEVADDGAARCCLTSPPFAANAGARPSSRRSS